jgi:curved DNA-binding protein CbpA
MVASKPTATGTLANTPFCELLVYALTQALTGSLVLECPDRSKHALLFHAGSPVKARVDNPALRLGDVLLSLGTIDEHARKSAEDDAEGELFGQRLFGSGAIDAVGLVRGLEEQLLRQLSWLARVPVTTAFAYYDQTDLLQQWGGGPLQIDVLSGIWRAVDANGPQDRIASVCHGLADKTLRLHPSSRIGRFGFQARERSVLDVLRVKPKSVGELEATGMIERFALHKVLYALVLTRHLDTGTYPLAVAASTTAMPAQIPRRRTAPAMPAARAPAAPENGPEPAATPARGRDAAQTGRFLAREEIEARLEGLAAQSHYDVLEVPPDASPLHLAQAFPNLARRWHPDRLSPDLMDLKDAVTRVFARMTEASRVLGQAASRAEYDRTLAPAGEEDTEQAQVLKVLRAAEAFQKAEIMLKKRDPLGAEKFAHMAHTGDKDQPEYGALYAWIRARRADASEALVAECLETLQQAVMAQPNNVKIRSYLAGVFKLAGEEAAALREYRFVAQHDPNNLDAVRELRLHDMRKNQHPGSQANAGLFDRLFKR